MKGDKDAIYVKIHRSKVAAIRRALNRAILCADGRCGNEYRCDPGILAYDLKSFLASLAKADEAAKIRKYNFADVD